MAPSDGGTVTTQAQLRAQRKQLEREMTADLKRKDRERLSALRARLRELRGERAGKLREVKGSCRRQRRELRAKGKAAIARVREQLQALRQRVLDLRSKLREMPKKLRSERDAAASSCDAGVNDARAGIARQLRDAQEALRSEQRDQKIQRLYAGRAKLSAPKASRAERTSESDDEVRNNIDPEMVPIFDHVKAKIHGSARRSRTEAFFEWVHDHPSIVLEIVEEETQKELRRLEAEERRFAKEVSSGRRYRRRSTSQLAESLAEVPF